MALLGLGADSGADCVRTIVSDRSNTVHGFNRTRSQGPSDLFSGDQMWNGVSMSVVADRASAVGGG